MRTLVVENDRLCPLGGLAGPLERSGAVDVWRPADDSVGPSLEGYDAVVALGGGQSPRDNVHHAWLADERALLAEAMDRRLGVLGVCLGGELIAQVLGADVGSLPAPEVGWTRLDPRPAAAEDELLSHVDGTPVLQRHKMPSRRPPTPSCWPARPTAPPRSVTARVLGRCSSMSRSPKRFSTIGSITTVPNCPASGSIPRRSGTTRRCTAAQIHTAAHVAEAFVETDRGSG